MIGDPLPVAEADQVWEAVWLDMKACCPDFMRGLSAASHARLWIENRNPFHVDAAVHLCAEAGIVPPPALARLIAEVASRRLRGEIGSGTPNQIKRDAARSHALSFMAALCAAGLNVERAASKVAASEGRYKASSLEKWYTGWWRKHEARLREHFTTTETGRAQREQWLRIIPTLPDAPEELRGNRRS